MLVVNRLRQTASSVAVALEGTAARRREWLDDLALITGGTLVAPDLGRAPEQFRAEWFGRARLVTVTAEQTTLVQGGGRNETLAPAIAALRRQLAQETRARAREVVRERLARLAGGIAVIHVGGASDAERRVQRARLEDALGATRSAIDEGLVPGGGLALVRAADAVRALELPESQWAGRELVRAAMLEPARCIGSNAGEEGGTVVARLQAGQGDFGFDARTGQWGDLVERGIVDPAKVVRCALQHAASVAILLLTTDAVVVDDDEDAQPPHAA